jgi:hypothetical protein
VHFLYDSCGVVEADQRSPVQMMVDARIRIEDMRHTLPNLKTLLLTVSAEVSSHDPYVKRRK